MSGEVRIARSALIWGALAAIPAAGLGFLFRGPDGAISVGLGVALVLANAAVAAGLSAFAGRFSTIAAAMVSLPSFAVRMALIFSILAALRHQPYIDGPTFALSFGLALTAVLTLEARAWKRTPWIALTLKEKP